MGAVSCARALWLGLLAVGAEPVGLDAPLEADAVRVVWGVAVVADEHDPLVVANPPHETHGSIDLTLWPRESQNSTSSALGHMRWLYIRRF